MERARRMIAGPIYFSANRSGTSGGVKRTLRHDRGQLTSAVERLDNGWIRTTGRVTRAGIFPYLQPDGSILRELRRPEEVFKADSLKTLQLVPLTLGHHGLITAQNYGALGVGNLGDSIKVEAPFVEAPLLIGRADAVSAVDGGVQELSCTYECDEDPTPGEWEGQPYDIEQKNIRYNSVAIVPRGRAGAGARIRLDGAEQLSPDDPQSKRQVQEPQRREDATGGTVKIRIRKFKQDGSDNGFDTIEVADGAAGEVEGMASRHEEMAGHLRNVLKEKQDAVQRCDALTTENADLKTKLAKAEGDTTAATARADSADRELKKVQKERQDALDPKAIATLVKERGALLARGIAVLGEEGAKAVKLDELEPIELKRKVLGKLVPDLAADKLKQDAYVEAAFDIEMTRFEKSNPALGLARVLIETPRTREDASAGEPDPLAAYQKMQANNQDAWKPKA